jgi:hypothetical protein
LRMIPFDQDFEQLQARVMFGMNKLSLSWTVGQPMPATLVDDIIKAIESPSWERFLATTRGHKSREFPPCMCMDNALFISIPYRLIPPTSPAPNLARALSLSSRHRDARRRPRRAAPSVDRGVQLAVAPAEACGGKTTRPPRRQVQDARTTASL